MPNDTTQHGYLLPHPDNIAVQDVVRIRDAITHIDVAAGEADHIALQNSLNKQTLETFLGVGL